VTQGTPREVLTRAQMVLLEEVFITIACEGRLQNIVEAREGD
jgi:hypothetical protein